MPNEGPSWTPTLADMLTKVAHLLSSCMPASTDSRAETIRVLRLTSKDVSCAVMPAVTNCTVQLGFGACPTPEQLAILLSGDLRLESLTVTVLTTSALDSPLLDEQLDTCVSQVQQLVSELEPAMQSITTLTIDVQHTAHKSSRSEPVSKPPNSQPLDPSVPTSPAPFAEVSRRVCATLAPALPSLQTLSVEGCCLNAALAAFGFNCPMLTHLQVEPLSVPIKTLKNINSHLLNLSSFTLKSQQPFSDKVARGLPGYVGDCLRVLQPCTSLIKIHLDLQQEPQLYCKHKGKSNWSSVSASLREFSCTSDIFELHAAHSLLANLHTLRLHTTTGILDLFSLLNSAPNLRRLTVTGPGPARILTNNALSSVPLLAKRCLAGLQLDLQSLSLLGSSTMNQQVLQGLTSLPSVQTCVCLNIGDGQPTDYTHISRVFPTLTKLAVTSLVPWLGGPEVGMELLSPLAACTSLKVLHVDIKMPYTTSKLADLCMSMPGLQEFKYIKNPGVGRQQLSNELSARGHCVEIQEAAELVVQF